MQLAQLPGEKAMNATAEKIRQYANALPDATALEIAKAAGVWHTQVYRALPDRVWPNCMRKRGTVKVRSRKCQNKRLVIAVIPTTALRAAGLDTAKQLKFTAANGKITFERV